MLPLFFHEDPYYAIRETEILPMKDTPRIPTEVILYGKCFTKDSITPGEKISMRTELHLHIKRDSEYWLDAMMAEENHTERIHGTTVPEIDRTDNLVLLSNAFAKMKNFIWEKQKELVF